MESWLIAVDERSTSAGVRIFGGGRALRIALGIGIGLGVDRTAIVACGIMPSGIHQRSHG